MSAIRIVIEEFLGMFWADGVLTAATLGLVALVAGLASRPSPQPMIAGGLLLFGCIGILVTVSRRAARRQVVQR